IAAFYKQIGDAMKQQFSDYDAWLISSNRAALKRIGLRASRKIILFNGPLECRFQHYELYRGTRKQK
ncbi:MAG: class I SAM-dependent RNA methyltransferase, partial [Bacteroidota bacterium]